MPIAADFAQEYGGRLRQPIFPRPFVFVIVFFLSDTSSFLLPRSKGMEMMNTPDQIILDIPLTDLHLWTENPRDPIDTTASDADIIHRAIENGSGNWNLDSLLAEMGERYLYNELPTVVFDEGSYIVYDGNRRVALLKCLQDQDLYQEAYGKLFFDDVPSEMVQQTTLPCNVCSKELALNIVERSHKSSDNWGKLQYELFLNKFREHPKGRLMLLDEATNGLVSKTPKLNEEYVQQRLLTNSNLYDTGFSVIDGELATSNDSNFARDILADIARVRTNDLSSARKNPGKLKDALAELNPDRYSFLEPFNPNKQITFLTGPKAVGSESESTSQETRKQPRKRPAKHVAQKLFGGTLQPRGERSNEIYRAIDDIYLRYSKDKAGRQYYLPIIAFSLRLLLETCAREYFAMHQPEVDNKDNALKTFLKLSKKQMVEAHLFETKTEVSLNAEWINGDIHLEAVLSKWAHGTLPADESSILRHSFIVGNIIRLMWSVDSN